MNISILTTITNPEKRQDAYLEAIHNYLDFADEVVIVNGGSRNAIINIKDYLRAKGYGDIQLNKIKVLTMLWAYDWSWDELPKHLNAGLNKCTGDWIIKLDIDQFIHEQDFSQIRNALEKINTPIASFQKLTVLPSKKYYQKGEMLVAINGNANEVCFGQAEEYTDLCMPIWYKELNGQGVPIGSLVREYARTGISIWNFDYTFKTKELTAREFYRFSMAHKRYFGTTKWGQNPEDSLKIFLEGMKARGDRAEYELANVNLLPKYIRDRYSNIKTDEFGYNGWGLI